MIKLSHISSLSLLGLLISLLCGLALAQVNEAKPLDKKPTYQDLQLTANGQIEVDRTNGIITATGDAVFVHKNINISGQKLILTYLELDEPGNKIAIKTIEVLRLGGADQARIAVGSRQIIGDKIKIICQGDKAGTVQHVQADGLAVVLMSDVNISANTQLIYKPLTGYFHGQDKVVIQDNSLTVRSNMSEGEFEPATLQITPESSKSLKPLSIVELNASGDVMIESLTLNSQSRHAKYLGATREVFLFGDVNIEQDNSSVTGEEVHVDLVNGINTVKDSSKGRVKAIIFGN